MSSKRNHNKKSWNRRHGKQSQAPAGELRPVGTPIPLSRIRFASQPTELDQGAAMIVQEELGLPTTSADALRAVCRRLPCEPTLRLLALLAGRVESAGIDAAKHLEVAEWFYGPGHLVHLYREFVANNPGRAIFAPQALYSLMRIVLEEAYEAPIAQDLTVNERQDLTSALLGCNSVTARRIDMNFGELQQDLLAFELQIGHYYHRGRWMEDIVRHRELYLLATNDAGLLRSPDVVPISEWLGRSELNAEEQFGLGFALGASCNVWDDERQPYVAAATVAGVLEMFGLAARANAAREVISADRAGYLQDFAELGGSGKRFIWELRPFNARPFLRTADGGLLLIGRPWLSSWLSEGFYYRPMRVAQAEDRAIGGRSDNVQRYTAYAGQTFERYCLDLAQQTIKRPARVWGEQPYAKGGSKTSDIAVLVNDELVLFEANARRVGAEPLVGGDPLDATAELAKLVVKKINQLGACTAALLDGRAVLPGVEIDTVKRIWPIVVAGGHVWQTGTLWRYLDATRDEAKCASLADQRVGPLQLLDPDDYEMLMALVQHGSDLPWMLARKTGGAWRHRDMAVWLNQDKSAPDHRVRLTSTLTTWELMTQLNGDPPAVDKAEEERGTI